MAGPEGIFGGYDEPQDKVDQEPDKDPHNPNPGFLTGTLRVCNSFAVSDGSFALKFEEMDIVDGKLMVPDGVIKAFSNPVDALGEAMIISMAIEVEDGRIRSIKQEGQFPLSQAIALPGGPGTELKKLIATFVGTKVCSKCLNLARQMDKHGCAWVRENEEEILDQIKQNADKLGAPFVRVVARRMVRTACWLAKQKGMCEGW